ncbi:hypothetical protein [Haloplasma contractile]|uniref:Uncharacterized protein n=1 Tax=Haloplasma contractile SSD-17B TaxID=1033810 RepID=F7PWS9_9MOLU|nr:hypothetical protein [Haloplasma contractile]ERJ12546.1 hypothetical protein HLPCO_001532 [Haloplasma contractile SSD-17B]
MSNLSQKKQEEFYLYLYLFLLILFTGLMIKGFYEVSEYFKNPYPTFIDSISRMNGGLKITLSRLKVGRLIYVTGFIGLVSCNIIYFRYKGKQKQLKFMRISATHNLKKKVPIERVAQRTKLPIEELIFIRDELDKNE